MLHYLAVIVKAKKVHRDIFVSARPCLMRVKCDQIAFRYGTDEFNGFFGILFCIRSKYSINGFVPSATNGLC